MAVISVTSPKGGAGKTTTATVLSTILAERGQKVILIDADPNEAVTRWASRTEVVPLNLTVFPVANEQKFVSQLDELTGRAEFVILDLEGRASRTVANATALSDFVIIPVKGSQLDAEQATRHIELIHDQECVIRRPIPFGLLFTQTHPAITPKTQAFVAGAFKDNGEPVFSVQLCEREAFRAIFSFGGTLAGLKGKGVGGLAKAVENADAFVDEFLARLAGGSERAAA